MYREICMLNVDVNHQTMKEDNNDDEENCIKTKTVYTKQYDTRPIAECVHMLL